MLKLPSLFPYFQARFAALIPAVMSSVLLFMDQTITVRLVNSPAYHLKKGAGYHLVSPPSFQQTTCARDFRDGLHTGHTEVDTIVWRDIREAQRKWGGSSLMRVYACLCACVLGLQDMLCISVLTLINSLLGLPWLVAATVRRSVFLLTAKIGVAVFVISTLNFEKLKMRYHRLLHAILKNNRVHSGGCGVQSEPRQGGGQHGQGRGHGRDEDRVHDGEQAHGYGPFLPLSRLISHVIKHVPTAAP